MRNQLISYLPVHTCNNIFKRIVNHWILVLKAHRGLASGRCLVPVFQWLCFIYSPFHHLLPMFICFFFCLLVQYRVPACKMLRAENRVRTSMGLSQPGPSQENAVLVREEPRFKSSSQSESTWLIPELFGPLLPLILNQGHHSVTGRLARLLPFPLWAAPAPGRGLSSPTPTQTLLK